ncbi:DUF6197 family protein [Streptomyces sp. NPDC004082]
MTRSRVAAVLTGAVELLEAEGWHPELNTVMGAIDRAAGFVKPGIDSAAEEATIQAWDALVTAIGDRPVVPWETKTGRSQMQVLHALRTAAHAVSHSDHTALEGL